MSKGDLSKLTELQRGDIEQRLTGRLRYARGSWRCEWCGFVTVADSMTCFRTFGDKYPMYICGTCVRHAQGHTCQTQGLDPVHCSECKDPAKSMLLTWTKRDGEPINVPSDEWMEAQLNHLKCQRDVLDRRIEAVETKLKRAKTE